MDPVQVLPPELVLRICSLLHIDDLVQLWELNSHWRQIVGEPSLWRLAELDLSQTWNVPNSLKVLRRAPCLGSIYYSADNDITEKLKDALLETKAVVRRLDNVSVDDPHWINQLIQHFGPNLKELSIWHPNEEVLNTVNTLPLLVKLKISYGNAGFGGLNCTLQVPDGFAGSLKSFCDDGLSNLSLPYDQLVSLLSSHSRTLENLCLAVGVSSDNRFDWPDSCDLLNLLDKCQLKALRYLVLYRYSVRNHCRDSCCVQLAAVKKFFPRVTVGCTYCHEVDRDCFEFYPLN